MKNIKTFDTHAEYNAYITGSTKVLPNISYCKDNDESHITAKPKITMKVYVNEAGIKRIFGDSTNVESVVIDGVVTPKESETGKYNFTTAGEHEVKILFKDSMDYVEEEMFANFISGTITVDILSIKLSNAFKEAKTVSVKSSASIVPS